MTVKKENAETSESYGTTAAPANARASALPHTAASASRCQRAASALALAAGARKTLFEAEN